MSEGAFTKRIERAEELSGKNLTIIKDIVAEAKQDFKELIVTRYAKEVMGYEANGLFVPGAAHIWNNKKDAPDDALEFQMVNVEKFIEKYEKWFGKTE